MIELLLCDLLCMRAQDKMNLMRAAIDLLEQSLQINRSAGTGRSNDKFHRELKNHNSAACSRQIENGFIGPPHRP